MSCATGIPADEKDRILTALSLADLVVVAASNGMDMSEGLNIFRPDAHFMQTYGDFAQRYGVQSILQGMLGRWPSWEERWAFQARFANEEWLRYEPSDVMRRVRALVGEKDHVVITCNTDGRFVRAGFDPALVVETEGSVRHLMCSAGCTDELWPAEDSVAELAALTCDCRVPTRSIPACPHCGAPLELAVREDRMFARDAALKDALARYEDLLAQAHGKNIVVLELGIGAANRAIKQPLMQLVAREPNATYVTFNYSEVFIPDAIAAKSVGISGDLGAALAELVPEV